MIPIRTCPDLTEEHRKNPRRYAHTFHYPNVICVAAQFMELPVKFRLGILIHECGHLIQGDRQHSERCADQTGARFARVPVLRADYGSAKNLEYVPAAYTVDAVRFCERHLINEIGDFQE